MWTHPELSEVQGKHKETLIEYLNAAAKNAAAKERCYKVLAKKFHPVPHGHKEE